MSVFRAPTTVRERVPTLPAASSAAVPKATNSPPTEDRASTLTSALTIGAAVVRCAPTPPGPSPAGAARGTHCSPTDSPAYVRLRYIERSNPRDVRSIDFNYLCLQLLTSVRRAHTTVQNSVGTSGAPSPVTAVLDLTWLQTVETALVRRHNTLTHQCSHVY